MLGTRITGRIRDEAATPYFKDAMGEKQFVDTFGKQWQDTATKAKTETVPDVADPTNSDIKLKSGLQTSFHDGTMLVKKSEIMKSFFLILKNILRIAERGFLQMRQEDIPKIVYGNSKKILKTQQSERQEANFPKEVYGTPITPEQTNEQYPTEEEQNAWMLEEILSGKGLYVT